MRTSRPFRLIALCIALLSMLFMQLAIASYACPGKMGALNEAASMAATTGDSGMVGCDGMDAEQPVLCHAFAHGDSAKLSLDHPHLPDVQPFVAVELISALVFVEYEIPFTSSLPPPAWLARASAPPIAIRHCCFRI